MKKILVTDPTLRDGSHAIGHQFSTQQVASYAKAADEAGIPIIEIGHGNGLGASSIQVGLSSTPDHKMIEAARKNIKHAKLEVFSLPGFATINDDLRPALEMGVDSVRVASHCTEADLTERHISFARKMGKMAYGSLMMIHMVPKETLVEEALKMESYGAQGVILMDSAGTYLPSDVKETISEMVNALKIPVGFHAHNNLGVAITNSITAVENGAMIVDGTACGLGGGTGNTQIELLVAVLEKMGYSTGIDLYRILDASDIAEKELMPSRPCIRPIGIVTGLSGVFSGFTKQIERIANQYNVDARDICFELGKRKVVAGQEDLIVEVAIELSHNRSDK
jgi:4-hydroxy 2-oxovalerate aldolase